MLRACRRMVYSAGDFSTVTPAGGRGGEVLLESRAVLAEVVPEAGQLTPLFGGKDRGESRATPTHLRQVIRQGLPLRLRPTPNRMGEESIHRGSQLRRADLIRSSAIRSAASNGGTASARARSSTMSVVS